MRRRRGQEAPALRKRPADGEDAAVADRRRRLLVAGFVLAGIGFGLGWGVATRVLFPGPPPTGDLSMVPDLQGMELREARERLGGAGLSVGVIESLGHPTADSGVVVGQAPLPGQLALPSSPVRVSVSAGKEQRSVPDVSRLRSDRARTVLESAGFEVLVDSLQDDLPRGSIVSLDPPAGTDLAIPGEVRVTVSMGPPQVTMPLILGLDEAQARDTLQALGLVVSDVEEVFRFGADTGVVVDQIPPSETVLDRGSAVRFMIGRADTLSTVRGPPGGNKRPRQP